MHSHILRPHVKSKAWSQATTCTARHAGHLCMSVAHGTANPCVTHCSSARQAEETESGAPPPSLFTEAARPTGQARPRAQRGASPHEALTRPKAAPSWQGQSRRASWERSSCCRAPRARRPRRHATRCCRRRRRPSTARAPISSSASSRGARGRGSTARGRTSASPVPARPRPQAPRCPSVAAPPRRSRATCTFRAAARPPRPPCRRARACTAGSCRAAPWSGTGA